MILIVFGIIAVIGQALNIALCLALDQIFSPMVGALAFVFLYIFVFAGAWALSLRIVEGRQESWRTATASR
jgi:hypothetical protein